MKKLAFLAGIYAILWIIVFFLDSEESDKEVNYSHSAIIGQQSGEANSKNSVSDVRLDYRARTNDPAEAIATTRQPNSQHQNEAYEDLKDNEDKLRNVMEEEPEEEPSDSRTGEAAIFENVVSPHEQQGVLAKYYERWQEQPDTPHWTNTVDKYLLKHIKEKEISLKDMSVSCHTNICRMIFIAEDVGDLAKLQSIPVIKDTVRTVGPLEIRPEGATVFVYGYNAPFNQ